MYWSATEAEPVGYESLLELSRLLMADFDRSSKHIVSQPFQITAGIEAERLTRVPDYLVLSAEEPLAIDVTRKARMDNPKYARLFDLTRRVVESRGWKYELAHEPARTEYLNIRFLAGYRGLNDEFRVLQVLDRQLAVKRQIVANQHRRDEPIPLSDPIFTP
jgi:hypothetical protein